MFKFRFIFIALLILFLNACHGPGVSEYHLGNKAYAHGNFQTAFVNYLFAAQQGITPAQYAVAYQYYYGEGTQANEQQAIYWFKKAAPDFKPARKALYLIQQNAPKDPWLFQIHIPENSISNNKKINN